jgi:hypothetical protein
MPPHEAGHSCHNHRDCVDHSKSALHQTSNREMHALEVCGNGTGGVATVGSLDEQHGGASAQVAAARRMHAHGGLDLCGCCQLP